ncbi:hypothetical protein L2E82_45182 [Cichorium intybus]|uniref:Uncharacterized protein n=1 Tax=Cichorium intybus TaxID=13427 RepID=A0ACB8ZS58_CICIN|nr:hypothetical protein L2E82_45182 [Cichorium intybus]
MKKSYIGGKLSNVIGKFSELKVLSLPFNKIRECECLSILNLPGNQIRGYIPDFLGNFVKLKGINLSMNRFTGSLRDEISSNCHVLEHVDLSGNYLNGKIPKSFGNIIKLRTMLLFSNRSAGVLPLELENLEMLEVLDVSRNRISGVLDEKLHVHCMTVFNVSRNLMFGSIPEFNISPKHT